MKKNQKMSKGITLISLVVTVIVLLLLAGISVSMLTGENGIILNAGNAKEQTEIATEKESIGTAAVHAINKSKFGDITQEKLQQQINNEFGEEKNAKVYEEDESFLVLVENRLYKVDKDGNVELSEENFELPKREFATQLSNNELGASDDKPYEIKCIEDLLDFSFKVNGIIIENNEITYSNTYNNFNNKFVALVRNLNFKSGLSYENAERTDYGDVNQDGRVDNLLTELTTGKGWICIGGYGETQNTNGFCGSFEGNDKIISELYINESLEKTTVGLFGCVGRNEEKYIQNLRVSGNILCNAKHVGGLIGHAKDASNTIIENCCFNGKIENLAESIYASGTGGIIGSGRTKKIDRCYCKGEIINHNADNNAATAGILGQTSNMMYIENSYNEAKIQRNKNDWRNIWKWEL